MWQIVQDHSALFHLCLTCSYGADSEQVAGVLAAQALACAAAGDGKEAGKREQKRGEGGGGAEKRDQKRDQKRGEGGREEGAEEGGRGAGKRERVVSTSSDRTAFLCLGSAEELLQRAHSIYSTVHGKHHQKSILCKV